MPEDTLANYHMQQLLVPGMLCQQALSHALLELDEPMSRYNESLQQVQRHLTAAAKVGLFSSSQSLQFQRESDSYLLHTHLSKG